MEAYLRADAAFAGEHTELKQYINGAGRELERRLLQAHLDLRAAWERPVEVRGADGTRRGAARAGSMSVSSSRLWARLDCTRWIPRSTCLMN